MKDLPGADEIGPVEHHRLGEGDLRFCVVSGKVIETADEWSAENVRQVLAMNAALSLWLGGWVKGDEKIV